jgi:hypothetical protein
MGANRRRSPLESLALGALVLALSSGVYGAEKTAAQATVTPPKPAASAGLANDWLCQQPARAAKEESLLLPTAFDSLCG